MSESPTNTRPRTAYVEDLPEEDQCTTAGTRKSSMVNAKISKQYEASDSGYSSRPATTSTSGSQKLFKLVSKMAGTKKTSKGDVASSTPALKKTVTKVPGKENLRLNTKLDSKVESRLDASRIQLSGEPIQRTASNRSYEKSPQVPRSAKMGPPPVPIPIKTAPRAGLIRPSSYHAGVPEWRSPLYPIHFAPPPQLPRQVPVHQPLPPQPHSWQPPIITSVPASMSPSRQTAYPFIPTIPAQYLPSSWEPSYQAPFTVTHAPQPPISRRYSMAGPPPLVEYPAVPPNRSLAYHHVEHSRPPVSFHEPQISYHPVVQDDAILLDEHELWYRQEEEARRAMLPSQRPPMRHAITVATDPSGQSKRNSMEFGQTPTFSRTGSFSSVKGQYRAPQLIQISSSRDIQTRRPDMVPVDHGRRSRPKSLHAGIDRELAAEQYQAEQLGSDRRPSLTTDVIRKANRSSKAAKSKASDSGSRSSGDQKGHDARKTAESRKKSRSQAVSVEVDEGCTATLTRSATGFSVRVRGNEERTGRQMEREDSLQRQESLTETTRNFPSRRLSTSQPSMRRERLVDLPLRPNDIDKRLTDKQGYTGDTAVEDDEYSEPEPEVLKKRGDKLTAQKLARLKTPTESRPNSRSARSVKSIKSSTSSRRGMVGERPHP